MQTANTTADALLDAPRPSVWHTLSRILLLALPFAVGAAATSTLNLGKVALLARVPDTGALATLSLASRWIRIPASTVTGIISTAKGSSSASPSTVMCSVAGHSL